MWLFAAPIAKVQISDRTKQGLGDIDWSGYNNTQELSQGVLKDRIGPGAYIVHELISSENFEISDDGLSVTQKKKQESLPISVFRVYLATIRLFRY
jgi:hypothetical protein